MAEMSPPEKPPRGVKLPKENSGVLMSVIRTLSASASNEQREKERHRLEKEFKKSDKHLEELVSLNDTDMTRVMQIFSKATSNITQSREKIHAVKENLRACKMLLHCKRDELKKLWVEGIEHKHTLHLLQLIDHVKDIPAEVSGHMSEKHYLQAAQLLVKSFEYWEDSLEKVEALKDLKMELQTKTEELHVTIMEDLSSHLYHHIPNESLQLRRQGSGRGDGLMPTNPFQRRGSDRQSSGRKRMAREVKARRMLLLEVPQQDYQGGSENVLVNGDTDIFNLLDDSNIGPDEESEKHLALLVECCALLNKLPDTVEQMKTSMQKELMGVAHRTTHYILDYTTTDPSQRHLLVELLNSLFDQFRSVVAAHNVVLRQMKRALEKHKSTSSDKQLYDLSDVWANVQAVIQMLLTDYLDIPNVRGSHTQAPTSFSEPSSDLSMYFARKRPQKPKKKSLFKFDYSSHTLTINNYIKNHKTDPLLDFLDGDLCDNERVLVCQPDPHHVTIIFNPLMAFLEELETALKHTGSHCPLYTFLTDFVRDVFLDQLNSETRSNVEIAMKTTDAWRANSNTDVMKNMSLPKPLLQSTISVWKSLEELCGLMMSLPLYADHFLMVMCTILSSYKETCHAVYRGIVQPESEDKRIISATWSKDADISRFLRSLPNWTRLESSKDNASQEEESAEEVRERNTQETKILTMNLGDMLIPQHETLADVQQLKVLAQLQESMEWLSVSILGLANYLLHSPSPASGPTVSLTITNNNNNNTTTSSGTFLRPTMPEASMQSLMQVAKEFEELADTCLLVLHLEVRVHCFFHLLPIAKQSSFNMSLETQDPDPDVLRLNKDLVNIDEALTTSLQTRKCRYIFEGVAHLVSTILIGASQYIRSMNGNGIKRMCRNIFSLQQTLSSITKARELALDQARAYYELCFLTTEEVLNGIIERGAQYTEQEYINLLQLLHRNQPVRPSPSVLNSTLQRLSTILGDVGVTV